MIVTMVLVKDVIAAGAAQQRITMNEAVAQEYATAMKAGCEFPPIVVFRDKQRRYWLGGGFHRLRAHNINRARYISCDVREGELRDAILFSVGDNQRHGLRRSPEDKEKAVITLLEDEEWGEWSSREIARRCGVSNSFVSGIRNSLSVLKKQMAEKVKTTRNGTTYMQAAKKKRIDQMTPKEQEKALNDGGEAYHRSKAVELAVKHLDAAAEAVGPYEDMAPVGKLIDQAKEMLTA